jgi:hypothetical protein
MVGPGFLYTKTQRNSINWKSVAAGARPWCRRTVPDCGLLPVAQKRPLAEHAEVRAALGELAAAPPPPPHILSRASWPSIGRLAHLRR